MTWTKLSDDFPDDCYRDELSDAAHRTHVDGLCWSNRKLLNGRIAKRDLLRFAATLDPSAAVAELVRRGYWRDDGNGWQIVHHQEHQESRDRVLRRRQVDADRQARHREQKLKQAESRRESRRDKTRDPGRDGPGRAGVHVPATTTADQQPDESAGGGA